MFDWHRLCAARHVLDFTRVLTEVEATLLPSRTCDYVYEFAKLFSKFYNVCNVGQCEPELKRARLGLLVVVVNTLKVGFSLIGLKTLDVM